MKSMITEKSSKVFTQTTFMKPPIEEEAPQGAAEDKLSAEDIRPARVLRLVGVVNTSSDGTPEHRRDSSGEDEIQIGVGPSRQNWRSNRAVPAC